MSAVEELRAIRLTVEVEQAKVAFRDKLIARLEGRVTALEKVLEPFAAIDNRAMCNDGKMLLYARDDALACGLNIRVADIRRAYAVFEAAAPSKGGET